MQAWFGSHPPFHCRILQGKIPLHTKCARDEGFWCEKNWSPEDPGKVAGERPPNPNNHQQDFVEPWSIGGVMSSTCFIGVITYTGWRGRRGITCQGEEVIWNKIKTLLK